MRATLVGFKCFKGKDGRKWVNLGLIYKDRDAQGGTFAQSLLISNSDDIAQKLVAGSIYNLDFDNRGRILDIELAE